MTSSVSPFQKHHRINTVCGVDGPSLDGLLEAIKGNLLAVPTPYYFAHLEQGSEDWYRLRNNHMRLTGSEFGAALGIDPSTSRQLLWRKKFKPEEVKPHSEFTQKILNWGKDNEKTALAWFRASGALGMVSRQVTETGTWVFEEDKRLGSTPDGLVFDDDGFLYAVLEIKCPYDQNVYAGLLDEENPYIKTHHYVQVLMEMRVTGAKKAYYVCWTPTCLVVAEVAYDVKLADNLMRRCLLFNRLYLDWEKDQHRLPARQVPGENARIESLIRNGQQIMRIRKFDLVKGTEKNPIFKEGVVLFINEAYEFSDEEDSIEEF
jgi:putative phage-type endonuclease